MNTFKHISFLLLLSALAALVLHSCIAFSTGKMIIIDGKTIALGKFNPQAVASYEEAVDLYRAQNYSAASEKCSEAIGQDSAFAAEVNLYRWRGYCASATKDYTLATHDFDKALLLSDPQNKSSRRELHRARGYAYFQTQNYTLAAQDYERALALDSRDTLSRISLIGILIKLKDMPRAKLEAKKLLEIDPSSKNKIQQTGLLPLECTKNAAPLSNFEASVVEETNLARTQPQMYAKFIEEEFKSMRPDSKEYFVAGVRMLSKEGRVAVDEAIRVLKETKPIQALQASPCLCLAARDHARDTGPKGMTGHSGSDGSTPTTRVSRYTAFPTSAGENVAYGMNDARRFVIQWLVDDGVPGRGHRINILNPDYSSMGAATGTHTTYKTMCVQVFCTGDSEVTTQTTIGK